MIDRAHPRFSAQVRRCKLKCGHDCGKQSFESLPEIYPRLEFKDLRRNLRHRNIHNRCGIQHSNRLRLYEIGGRYNGGLYQVLENQSVALWNRTCRYRKRMDFKDSALEVRI